MTRVLIAGPGVVSVGVSCEQIRELQHGVRKYAHAFMWRSVRAGHDVPVDCTLAAALQPVACLYKQRHSCRRVATTLSELGSADGRGGRGGGAQGGYNDGKAYDFLIQSLQKRLYSISSVFKK